MKPIVEYFDKSKIEVMNEFSAGAEALKMAVAGRNNDLGLISLNRDDKPKLYAHFVEKDDNTTKVSIAPGLSYMKDRDEEGLPASAINRLLNEIK